jgi:hypothetical protein
VYSHKNLITKLEVFPKHFLVGEPRYIFFHWSTPFIAEENTVMTTHTRSKRVGKSGLKAEKELIFVRDLCVSPTHRGLKDAATLFEAWTVQAEP